uniref:Zinc finger CGNR domain-containing protein n=1 Tax=uncultured soil bacterium TaxID=164851 RepID=E2D2Q5_9BACT|nr:hypothetical protein [uncultured soil bacterium]
MPMTQVEMETLLTDFPYGGCRAHGEADLESVRRLRGPLRELFTSDRDDAVRLVNGILAGHGARLQLVRHDEGDWHPHAIEASAPLASRIAVAAAMAMIDLIRADELERLSICTGNLCDGIVVDLSRNRTRRFCSTACGNRAAAAAYRARKVRSQARIP